MDKISVIIPVHNAERFLNKSVESVINQSYQDIELILVNDGSSDKSEMLCNNYALTDKRIKVFSQANRGPAAARNTGIRHATGTFIFFLDADDFIEKECLEILVATYNQYQPDIVISNFSKLENTGETIKQIVCFRPDGELFTGRIKKLSKTDITAYVRHFLKRPSDHLISYCWTRLYKLSVIKNNGIIFNEDMRLFEDFIFNLNYFRYTNELIFVNETFYTYTMHNTYVSASMSILNADVLLHDMNIFKTEAGRYLQEAADGFDKTKEIGHALVHYVIIFLIRSCRQITGDNRKKIYDEIIKLVNAPILKDSLLHYSPSRGNSKMLPLLMKLKLIGLLMLVCKHKAYKRYGRPPNA